jgi:hypothetical protein
MLSSLEHEDTFKKAINIYTVKFLGIHSYCNMCIITSDKYIDAIHIAAYQGWVT